MLSVAFSLALMTILYGYLAMQEYTQREAIKHDRVVVLNKLGFASPLPMAHIAKIEKLESITAATPFAWFGGNYKGERSPFAQFSVDPQKVFDVYSEYEIPDDQVAAFKKERQGCVVDKNLAEAMKWKLGDRIPLEGTIYQEDLDLKLVGIYEAVSYTHLTLPTILLV